MHIDTWVPADALIARPGTGLAAISWALAHERMSIAGQIAAACQRVIGITLARMMKRRQFGHALYEHQALRMRMADLQARVDLLRYGLAECMHIFAWSGYLVDETPLGSWWRDMKLARVGGGTDEVLWTGCRGDEARLRRLRRSDRVLKVRRADANLTKRE